MVAAAAVTMAVSAPTRARSKTHPHARARRRAAKHAHALLTPQSERRLVGRLVRMFLRHLTPPSASSRSTSVPVGGGVLSTESSPMSFPASARSNRRFVVLASSFGCCTIIMRGFVLIPASKSRPASKRMLYRPVSATSCRRRRDA